jgi:flagellar biosynthesis protein FlhA
MVQPALPALPVLSYTELVGATQVRSVGIVSGNRLAVSA